MDIREVTSADDLAPFGFGKPWRWVAEVGGELAGVASREPSMWHPAWDWADVLVQPRFRRVGVGTALLSYLGRPCKAKVPAGSGGADFLRGQGWTLLQGCEIHEVQTTRIRNGTRTEQLSSVSQAWFAFYVRAHAWDPLSTQVSVRDLAETVANADASFLVGTEEDPEAVACLWSLPGAYEFSGGACRDGVTLTTLFDQAASFANGKPLQVEVDSDMQEVHAELSRRGSTILDSIEIFGHGPPQQDSM